MGFERFMIKNELERTRNESPIRPQQQEQTLTLQQSLRPEDKPAGHRRVVSELKPEPKMNEAQLYLAQLIRRPAESHTNLEKKFIRSA